MGEFWRLRDESNLEAFCKHVRAHWPKTGWRLIPWEDRRSTPQNDISHVWYEQVARELGEASSLDVKCECKLHHGVPILRAEDAEFREVYDRVIKPRTYEEKLECMKVLPVTSRMSKGQLSRYLEAVRNGYAGRVRLEYPEERADDSV